MQKVNLVIRILLGLALLAFGLNKFLGFMPPPELNEKAGNLMGALAESGYLLSAAGVVEILVGALLVTGLFVPLALILLVPISVNIVLFHVFLDPSTILPAAGIAAINLYLLFTRIDAYRPLLKPKG
jgi:uncharacterized membrane protein YphA (DoxX/SURF4 family)